MIQWLRSLIFIGQMYLMMALMAVFFTPWALVDRRGAFAGVRTYTKWVRWTAAWMVGLKTEIRGTPPTGEVLIAAKHQSFLDIIMIVSVVPRPKFIMKQQLKWAPILGWYALRIGCVPVDRGKRAEAIRQMVEGVKKGTQLPGQLIIYPQGTRVAPGAAKPYKVGSAILYQETGQTCIPAATNVGVFWPRHGIYRKPGLAVVEFLPPIEPGMEQRDFMVRLETEVEAASNRLMKEAGFHAKD
ncbi:1-acyl-sn-glycerol-3-phosphate acyltransferase [Roseibacterium sp. SDUM158016]|jgi:1-acyl-sn-glycerol-3-phosphate acyltransferase|uniref:lysophospholipid acyltransferase family protein n=1 Tax=Roseicyclus sediminis TaxID=2980997 RepID=UPI0021D01053|nr:lysophospholipid acyltransferase family protein [Roseibacterium sp. SDUM158016]MCU4652534.1 1-acyl-sn-glycerol-3-phosphate acyltransferase [Roseibacterium sp. SDUM158016]